MTGAVVVSDAVRKPRDPRLDVWRGLCLVDMVLVHCIEVSGLVTREFVELWLVWYLKFAAGGFILVSGLSVGAIYGKRLNNPEDRRSTYGKLLSRAGQVLVAHLAMVLLLVAVRSPGMDAAGWFVWQSVTLRGWEDLLPFYVVMLLAAPLMLALLRRGLWWALLLLSAGLFAAYDHWPGLGHFSPPLAEALAAYFPPERTPGLGNLPMTKVFLPLKWQALFVLGTVGGWYLTSYDRLMLRRGKLALTGGFVLAAVVLTGLKFQHDLGLPPSTLDFEKVPLGAFEVLRYVALSGAIFLAVEQLLPWVLRLLGPVATLGRHALPVYATHMLFVGPISRRANEMPIDVRPLMMLLAVAVVFLFALATQAVQRRVTWASVRHLAAPAAIVLSLLLFALGRLL